MTGTGHDITTRADIERLVDAFYAQVRADEILAPIFDAKDKERARKDAQERARRENAEREAERRRADEDKRRAAEDRA